MYIDRDRALAHEISPIHFEVERGRIRFFAETIGLCDPIHFDVDAARRAGHRDLVVPATFLGQSLELQVPRPLEWLEQVGGDLTKTTHAEQKFVYHSLAYAGDQLILKRRIVDVYTRKSGALEFVVKRTEVMRGAECLALIESTIALRHPEAQ